MVNCPFASYGPTGVHGLWRLSAGVTSNPSLPRGVCPVVVRTPTDTCYDSSAVPSRPNDKELGEVVIPASAASAGMSSRPEPWLVGSASVTWPLSAGYAAARQSRGTQP